MTESGYFLSFYISMLLLL